MSTNKQFAIALLWNSNRYRIVRSGGYVSMLSSVCQRLDRFPVTVTTESTSSRSALRNALRHLKVRPFLEIRQWVTAYRRSTIRGFSHDAASLEKSHLMPQSKAHQPNSEKQHGAVVSGSHHHLNKPLFVFSGPSGSGKSTLIKRLIAEFPARFAFSVSHTTRLPRPGETAGVDYHYVDEATMQNMIAGNEFVEHAKFSGNTYGTSLRAIEHVNETGRLCLLDVDMQGVRSVKHARLPARFIFVKPPSLTELETRLRGRGTESEDAVQKRLAAAKAELAFAESVGSDNNGKRSGPYDYIIVNDELDHAYEQLKKIIFDEEVKMQTKSDKEADAASSAFTNILSHA